MGYGLQLEKFLRRHEMPTKIYLITFVKNNRPMTNNAEERHKFSFFITRIILTYELVQNWRTKGIGC